MEKTEEKTKREIHLHFNATTNMTEEEFQKTVGNFLENINAGKITGEYWMDNVDTDFGSCKKIFTIEIL